MKDTETRTRAAAKRGDDTEGRLSLDILFNHLLELWFRCLASRRIMGHQKHCHKYNRSHYYII